jgi:hypothetical protein
VSEEDAGLAGFAPLSRVGISIIKDRLKIAPGAVQAERG